MASRVERRALNPEDEEYKEVLNFFDSQNVVHGMTLKVVSIEKVYNRDLERRFLEKKEEYLETYDEVRVVKVWHGTKEEYVESILENNYDVSRHGQGVGHRFGAGMSFSSMASYASNYCDKDSTDTMLLNDVLVSNIIEVEENRGGSVLLEPPYIPGRYPLRYDTTAKNAHLMDVIVKFDDDSYLPTHVVRFTRH